MGRNKPLLEKYYYTTNSLSENADAWRALPFFPPSTFFFCTIFLFGIHIASQTMLKSAKYLKDPEVFMDPFRSNV